MVGKSVWGPAIWYLFHTLAFKMKNQHFNEMKNSLLDFFVLVSANLPCPECTEHAQQETRNLDKSKITNKKYYIIEGDDEDICSLFSCCSCCCSFSCSCRS